MCRQGIVCGDIRNRCAGRTVGGVCGRRHTTDAGYYGRMERRVCGWSEQSGTIAFGAALVGCIVMSWTILSFVFCIVIYHTANTYIVKILYT